VAQAEGSSVEVEGADHPELEAEIVDGIDADDARGVPLSLKTPIIIIWTAPIRGR